MLCRALTEEQIEILADEYIIGLYQSLEQEVIADIARRVQKMGRYTETAELMAKSMLEKGYSPNKIAAEVFKLLEADEAYRKAVEEATLEYKKEIKELIEHTVEEAKEKGDRLIAHAGTMSWNDDLSMWEEHGQSLTGPNTLSQLIEAFQQQTVGELKNLTRSTGFVHTVLGKTGVLQAFQREMDLAVIKIASGVFSYDVAVNDCITRLAQSGLRKIDYKNGKSWQLDTAARMCVRTCMSQLAGRVTEMNLRAMKHDLVITSQHSASRPEHAPWQNKVFSYSGNNKKYESLEKGTGYGTPTGLKGVNCTHNFYPYWEGDYIPPDIEYDETVYRNTQKQRAMERKIRATRREIEAQKAIGGSVTELKGRLKKQIADYNEFSHSVGIRPKPNRHRVVGGTSDLKKTKSYIIALERAEKKITGALNDKNDPLGKKRNKHALQYYEQIRNRKSQYVIDKIANNAGISKRAAKDIYEHIFIKEHIFENGIRKRFDVDYDMGESIRRILEGKDIKPHDIVLLKHENLELNLMKKYNLVYEDAHEKAEKKYNYSKALYNYLEEVDN